MVFTLVNRCYSTCGGLILHRPVFSAISRILWMKLNGSLKSCQLGSNTGHSGGAWNSRNSAMSYRCASDLLHQQQQQRLIPARSDQARRGCRRAMCPCLFTPNKSSSAAGHFSSLPPSANISGKSSGVNALIITKTLLLLTLASALMFPEVLHFTF